jgi:hydrogenase 3 maturation protease
VALQEDHRSAPLAVERDLRTWLSGATRVAIVGIGGPLQGDDAVGARIAQGLLGRTSCNVLPMACWTVPESCTGPIRAFCPTHVLLIDAAELGQPAGTCRLVEPDALEGLSLSTHSAPLRLVAEFLSRTTGAQVALLAVQPKSTELGERMTGQLLRAAAEVAEMLLRVIGEETR